jgi:predicted RNase H-like nuclease (RuvC/YqgF family)
MDSSEEEEEEGDEIKELREQLTTLKLRMNNMDERVAESEIERMDLDDKVDTLRKAVCSKIKRLAKVTGNEDLYTAPRV